MRSSKSRSRSKSNRNRPTAGNIVNRVFDSSGPEGKVRGTPQQIIDKYNQLARDAQLSGDRVATENFQQHSEHYTRMLSEAQREIDEQRERQEQQFRERQQQQNEQRGPTRGDEQTRGDDQPRPDDQPRRAEQPQRAARPRDEGQPQPDVTPRAPRGDSSTDVLDFGGDDDSGLVETPESKPAPKPRTRRPRKPAAPKPEAGEAVPADAPKGDGGASEAAE